METFRIILFWGFCLSPYVLAYLIVTGRFSWDGAWEKRRKAEYEAAQRRVDAEWEKMQSNAPSVLKPPATLPSATSKSSAATKSLDDISLEGKSLNQILAELGEEPLK